MPKNKAGHPIAGAFLRDQGAAGLRAQGDVAALLADPVDLFPFPCCIHADEA